MDNRGTGEIFGADRCTTDENMKIMIFTQVEKSRDDNWISTTLFCQCKSQKNKCEFCIKFQLN